MKRLLLSAVMVFGIYGSANAAPIYSCPGGNSECAGQTFALYLVNSGAGFFDIAFSINTTGYTGSENDLAYGVEFKNVTDDNQEYSAISYVGNQVPGGNAANWRALTDQLSQDCLDPTADFHDTGCGSWQGAGQGYNFAIGDILTWVFHVTETFSGDGTGHIKYEYRDGTGKKVAGLLSADVPLQDCRAGGCDNVTVPEPATLLLFAAGLGLGVRAVRRRRPAL